MNFVENFIRNLQLTDESLTEKFSEEIKRIYSEIECEKDFECLKSGGEKLCQAKDIGLENYLIVILKAVRWEKPALCKSGIPFGYSHMCKCQLRIYICRKLRR